MQTECKEQLIKAQKLCSKWKRSSAYYGILRHCIFLPCHIYPRDQGTRPVFCCQSSEKNWLRTNGIDNTAQICYELIVTSSLEAYYLRAKTRISRFWTKLCVTLDHCLTTALLKNVFCRSTLPQTASPILLISFGSLFSKLPGSSWYLARSCSILLVSSCFRFVRFVQSHTGSAPSQRGADIRSAWAVGPSTATAALLRQAGAYANEDTFKVLQPGFSLQISSVVLYVFHIGSSIDVNAIGCITCNSLDGPRSILAMLRTNRIETRSFWSHKPIFEAERDVEIMEKEKALMAAYGCHFSSSLAKNGSEMPAQVRSNKKLAKDIANSSWRWERCDTS